ncbi:MAG: N-acetyltransferase [Chloroflexi bacterium]|nr:MAG: N-acetyltransferase [Chloroflexota bacterium]
MNAVDVRDYNPATDRDAVLAINRTFTTTATYRVAASDAGFQLVVEQHALPVVKQFPLDDPDDNPAFVALRQEEIVGFAAFRHQIWNRRTEIWHFYVSAQHRRQGVGSALMRTLLATSGHAGMRCIWLETSNLAYPAIQFYRSAGFTLCGLDTTLYDPSQSNEVETALYFARQVAG